MTRAVRVLAVVAVVCGVVQYPLAGEAKEWAANAGWTLAALCAVLGCRVAARQVDASRRPAWRTLTVASGLWLAGQLTWDLYGALNEAPAQPTLADAFWLGFAVVGAVGVARLSGPATGVRRYRALEVAAVAVGVSGLALSLLAEPLKATGLSTAGAATCVAYAVLYVAALGMLVQALPRGLAAGRHRDLLLLLAGFALQALAFSWWAPVLLDGTYVAGNSPIDAIWVAGMVLIGLGGLEAPRSAPMGVRTRRESNRGGLLPSVLLVVVLAALMGLAVADASLASRLPALLAATIMAVLLLIRSSLFTRELIAAEEELAGYVELAPAMLGAATPEGYFVRANQAFEDTLGYPLEEFQRMPFFDFVHPDDVERTEQEMGALLEGNVTVHFENRYRCADGSYKWLLWSSHLVEADGLVHAAARDITEIKDLQADLERSNTDLERFAYAASHDLAEPLRTISSFSQLVMRDAGETLPERSRGHLTHVVEGAERMRVLIEAMLQYSRAGRRAPRIERVPLGPLVDQAVEQLADQLGEAGAIVTHEGLPEVAGDPDQLKQVMQNLISNAVKFRGEGAPRVHVSGARENGGWHVEVADDGIGIEERHQEQIFAMFERLHSRADYEGTGIGLALCAKIVERHGGRIWVESEPGSGSTFHFTIEDRGSHA